TPSAPSAGNSNNYCEDDPLDTLFAIGPGIVWFSDPTLTNPIDSGTEFIPFPIIGTITYYVTQTIFGCQSPADSVVITINAIPAAPEAQKDTTYCKKDLNLVADLTAAGSNIEWFSDPGLTNLIGTGSSYTPVNLVEPTTYYYYVTQTINNCQSIANSVFITINAIPAKPVAQKDTIYCEVDIDLVANLTAAGSNIEWFSDPGLSILLGTGSPFAPFPDVGTNIYYVTQTVSDCQSWADSVIIIVEGEKKCVEWQVFTGITPNSDENKTWMINKGSFKDVRLNVAIYNRWGDLVWKSENYLNDWAGTNKKGQPLPDGTYFYIVDRVDEIFTGWLNIAR
ncbi:MAG: gliding motility-associated C-terminal domain-containing protein, partial [Bacteroidetes bacterium]|nr:gliding motility-associated C-terminal domain-containing protein [Bacteroidota bacterium]